MSLDNEKVLKELWKKYLDTKSKDSRDKILVEYSLLVKYIALKISGGLPDFIEVDDLISVGIMGLIKAVESYDPKYNTKFETYANFKIKGAILDELRSMDWVSRTTRQQIKQYNRAYQELSSKLGREPYSNEIAEYLGVSEEELEAITSEIAPAFFSIETSIDDGEGEIRFEDVLKDDRAENPIVNIEKNELKEIIKNSISELNEKERLVVALYHFEELNLKEIGSVLNITEGRVSQIHSKAMVKLRVKVNNKMKEIEI